ncbi:MAG TPA: DUF4124 domain-containing protein [Sideroxyarcus sp.]|nr:DUF4124 domain-containing protein [Sideroxyarcus sp.]
MRRQLAFIVLSVAGLSAHAGVNKCVDSDGNVVYSDTCTADKVKIGTVRNVAGKESAAPTSPPQKNYMEREAELKKTKQAKDEAEKKKDQQQAIAEAKKQNCLSAQNSERTLMEGGRIVTYGENGERSYMDEAAREQRLENARKAISENCN